MNACFFKEDESNGCQAYPNTLYIERDIYSTLCRRHMFSYALYNYYSVIYNSCIVILIITVCHCKINRSFIIVFSESGHS